MLFAFSFQFNLCPVRFFFLPPPSSFQPFLSALLSSLSHFPLAWMKDKVISTVISPFISLPTLLHPFRASSVSEPCLLLRLICETNWTVTQLTSSVGSRPGSWSWRRLYSPSAVRTGGWSSPEQQHPGVLNGQTLLCSCRRDRYRDQWQKGVSFCVWLLLSECMCVHSLDEWYRLQLRLPSLSAITLSVLITQAKRQRGRWPRACF